MSLSRAHTAAKAADVAELSLLNKRRVARTDPSTRSTAVPTPNRNPNQPYSQPYVTWSGLPPQSTASFRGPYTVYHVLKYF